MSSDIHALSGAYALDALDNAEREAFERHLAVCDTCQAEVDSLREAAVSLAETVALTPPAALRDQVLGSIAKVRPLPPVVPIARRRAARRLWIGGALIAAAVIALVVVLVQPQSSTAPPQLSAADQIIQASDAVSVSQKLPNGAQIIWYRSKSLGGAAVAMRDLPQAATGKTYELWLQSADGVMLPAGLTRGGTQVMTLHGEAASAVGAGLTIEPEGGSEEPTLPAVTVAAFPGT